MIIYIIVLKEIYDPYIAYYSKNLIVRVKSNNWGFFKECSPNYEFWMKQVEEGYSKIVDKKEIKIPDRSNFLCDIKPLSDFNEKYL